MKIKYEFADGTVSEVTNTNDSVFREHPEFLHMLEEYKKSIQTALRVGCFTTCDYTKIEMWDNQYFGDEHKGYCIEYKVEPRYFYPDTLVFLKVLYDNNEFNATDAMKNFVEWVKLKQDGRENSLHYKECAMKMVCQGHNHTLFKPEEYKGEDEWRIVIPKNRYVEYFGKEDIYTKDFSPLMQAIYLGSEFRNTDKSGEMYEYALEVCKRLHIPLYIMQRNGDKLEEKMEYSPEK